MRRMLAVVALYMATTCFALNVGPSARAEDSATDHQPPAAPSTLRMPRFLIVSGVVLALGSATSGIWWMERSDTVDECTARAAICNNREDLQDQARNALTATVGLGIASLGVTTLGALWLRKRKQAQPQHVSLWGHSAHGMLQVGLSGRF